MRAMLIFLHLGKKCRGIAGRNNGNIIIENSRSVITRSISAGNATGVGGLAGMNETNGTIRVTGDGETGGEITVVDAGLSVSGSSKLEELSESITVWSERMVRQHHQNTWYVKQRMSVHHMVLPEELPERQTEM